MRKHRLLVTVLVCACMGQVRAQTPPTDDDRELTNKAARVLLQLPAEEREAFTKELATMSPEARRAALKALVAKHPGATAGPDLGQQLQALWGSLPPKERQRLLGEAMKNLKSLPPDQQKFVLEQVKRVGEAAGGAVKPAAAPDKPQGVLGRALGEIDKLLEKHGPQIEELARKVEETLGQGRSYYEMYKALPPDQKAAVLRELEDGIVIFLDENVMPELEQRIKGLKELRAESSRIRALLNEYGEAFRGIPDDQRGQIMKDLIESGKLFFRETIVPEIEKQIEERGNALRERIEELSKLPADERNRRIREALKKLFR